MNTFHTLACQLLNYDPSIGSLIWRRRDRSLFNSDKAWKTWNARMAGKEAGSDTPEGYSHVGLIGKYYKKHRLCWFLHYGYWPEGILDHINRDKSDNRINNLREASRSENSHNRSEFSSSNTGLKNIEKRGNKYRVCFKLEGRLHRVGNFDCVQSAKEALASYKEGLQQ